MAASRVTLAPPWLGVETRSMPGRTNMTSSICPHGENSCCMLISPFISHGEISFRTGGLGVHPSKRHLCYQMTYLLGQHRRRRCCLRSRDKLSSWGVTLFYHLFLFCLALYRECGLQCCLILHLKAHGSDASVLRPNGRKIPRVVCKGNRDGAASPTWQGSCGPERAAPVRGSSTDAPSRPRFHSFPL